MRRHPTTLAWAKAGARGGFFLALALGARADQATVVIKGSNTFGEELAPALIRRFHEEKPDARLELESKGSDSGIAAILAGGCDIASSSRRVSEDEQRLAHSRGMKLKVYLIGFYGVAVVVNHDNPVDGLSDQQVREIFTGKIGTWKSLGGPDSPVHLYIRDPASGTYLGFQELAMDKKPYAPAAKMLSRYDDIAGAVAKDRDGIGYVSMALAQPGDIKALRINRVLPTPDSVNAEDYPYSRTLRLITAEGHESPAVRDFIQFVLSGSGQDLLSEIGFVRIFAQQIPSPDM